MQPVFQMAKHKKLTPNIFKPFLGISLSMILSTASNNGTSEMKSIGEENGSGGQASHSKHALTNARI